MTSRDDKIAKLRALALHPNTPIEEARTAALTALRLEGKAPDRPHTISVNIEDVRVDSSGAVWYVRRDETQAPASRRRERGGSPSTWPENGPNGGRPRRGRFIARIDCWRPCATCGKSIEHWTPAWFEGEAPQRYWHGDCADPPVRP